jgi:hypothetical protein
LISNTDYTTFNNKVSTTRTISTTAPLTGGGDLSADRTIAIPQAAAGVSGYLSATDWSIFTNKALTFKSTTDGTSVAVTTNTITYSQYIPANTFAPGDIIRISYRTIKTAGTAGNSLMRINVNSTNTLVGATVVALWTSTTTSFLYNQMLRHLVIKSATNTEVTFATLTLLSDIAIYNGTTNLNISWTTDTYIMFSIANGAAGDTSKGSFFLIEKL